MTIIEMLSLPWSFVEGIFQIAQGTKCVAKNGVNYDRLLLKDKTGIMTAFAWSNNIVAGTEVYPAGAWIRLRGTTRIFHGRCILDVKVAEVSRDYPTSKFYHSAPHLECLRDGVLRRLHHVVSEVHTESLRDFLDGVFTDMSVATPMVQVPASLRYHHSYPAGLIEHSVECAEIVGAIPRLSQTERDLAVVAALFHDIGKIRTMTADMKRTEIGKLVDHDSLTTDVLGSHLAGLECVWPYGAYALRHIWSCMSTKHWAYRPAFSIVHIVKMADRVSSDMADKSKLVRSKGVQHFGNESKNRLSFPLQKQAI